jgi:hypothetical protein
MSLSLISLEIMYGYLSVELYLIKLYLWVKFRMRLEFLRVIDCRSFLNLLIYLRKLLSARSKRYTARF